MLPGAATDELAEKLRLYTLTFRRATEEREEPEAADKEETAPEKE